MKCTNKINFENERPDALAFGGLALCLIAASNIFRSRIFYRSVAGLVLGLFWGLTAAQPVVLSIETRPGVQVKFLYVAAQEPIASAVLFQGGFGNIGLYANGSMREAGFLSGSGARFAASGVSVVIPDVPSDRSTLNDFRDSAEHGQDNAALMEFLRQRVKRPVWAVGISNGSLSAAAAATRLGARGPDGVVLMSTLTQEGRNRQVAHLVSRANLADVKVPAVLVHHKQDGCYVTPFSGVPGLQAALSASPKVVLLAIEGGSNQGNPCHTGHHQFLGQEEEVIAATIAAMQRFNLGATPAK